MAITSDPNCEDWEFQQAFNRDVKANIDSYPSVLDLFYVPYFIPSSQIFTVPEYKQVLFSEPITVEGILTINGILIGVT